MEKFQQIWRHKHTVLLVLSAVLLTGAVQAATGRQGLLLFSCGVFCLALHQYLPRAQQEIAAPQEDDMEVEALRQEIAALRLAGTGAGLLTTAASAPSWEAPQEPAQLQRDNLLHALHSVVHGATANNVPSPMQASQSNMSHSATPAAGLPPTSFILTSVIVETMRSLFRSAGDSLLLGASLFWNYVGSLESAGQISPEVLQILQNAGYHGPNTTVIPDVASLEGQLQAHGTMGAPPGLTLAGADSFVTSAEDPYLAKLPADFKRAAREIYVGMRSEGTTSARQWLKDNYHGYKGAGSQWVDLWSTASQVDFQLAKGKTDSEINHMLDTDDSLEIMLRHLGAYFYEARTHDRTGAAMMRAVATPGFGRDVMPTWLVTEATTFSKAEFQRSERVRTELRNRQSEAEKKPPKGHGRGKQNKSQD